jgi:hypothetical protein
MIKDLSFMIKDLSFYFASPKIIKHVFVLQHQVPARQGTILAEIQKVIALSHL